MAVVLGVVAAAGGSAGLLFVPAAGGFACAAEMRATFEPPLSAAGQAGTFVLQAPPQPASCAAALTVDCGLGAPACAGLFLLDLAQDRVYAYRGSCALATLEADPGQDPDGNANAVLAGGTLLAEADPFSATLPGGGPRVVLGVASREGRLAPDGGDPCAMAAATCACTFAFQGILPP